MHLNFAILIHKNLLKIDSVSRIIYVFLSLSTGCMNIEEWRYKYLEGLVSTSVYSLLLKLHTKLYLSTCLKVVIIFNCIIVYLLISYIYSFNDINLNIYTLKVYKLCRVDLSISIWLSVYPSKFVIYLAIIINLFSIYVYNHLTLLNSLSKHLIYVSIICLYTKLSIYLLNNPYIYSLRFMSWLVSKVRV